MDSQCLVSRQRHHLRRIPKEVWYQSQVFSPVGMLNFFRDEMLPEDTQNFMD